jgi:hypothetical protein
VPAHPPVSTRTQVLPFGELTWENFERLCYRLAGQNERIEYIARYGRSGQAQQGIDIFVRLANGKYEVWQAKRYEAISASDVKAIVKTFRDIPRQAARDLVAADGKRIAIPALDLGLADADDGGQSRPPGRCCLRGYHRVSFPMMSPPLRVADVHRRRTRVLQHPGADVPGKRAGGFGVAVLAAEGNSARGGLHRAGQQGRRHTDQHVRRGRPGVNGCGDGLDLMELNRQPMHLPIPGDQGSHSAGPRVGKPTDGPSYSGNQRQDAERGHQTAAGQEKRQEEAKGGGYRYVFVLDQHRCGSTLVSMASGFRRAAARASVFIGIAGPAVALFAR